MSAKTIATVAVLACLFTLVASGLLFPVMIFGESMEPTMPSGSGGIALKTGDYDKGDVIVYDTEYGTVIHRIVGRSDGASSRREMRRNTWILGDRRKKMSGGRY